MMPTGRKKASAANLHFFSDKLELTKIWLIFKTQDPLCTAISRRGFVFPSRQQPHPVSLRAGSSLIFNALRGYHVILLIKGVFRYRDQDKP